MGKYIKSNSVFTLRKRIQNLEGGATILERDWTTLGERLKFGKGKTPIYNDGNFIFTRANIKLPSRRSKPSSDSVELKYDDVKDVKSNVNNVELNTNSNDIRSFVYYGSCVDLVDKSISNIIMNFPGCIAVTDRELKYATYDEEGNINGYESFKNGSDTLYVVDNAFNIDILSKDVKIGKYDNPYRYMCETYNEYEVITYDIDENGNTIFSEPYNIEGFSVEYAFDKCYANDQWFNYKGNNPPIHIIFNIENRKPIEFFGFRNNNDFIFLCSENKVVIKPNENVIENYFNTLKGFEKQLLTRNSKPLYKNVFITPVETDESYVYVQRGYTWPSSYGYCININSSGFESFYNNLIEMATIYDEIWTNILYGRMTHEAIKNFDWTYSKDYVDGDEEENVEGGEQMQKVIHFIGRVFDEGKQYIDGIKNSNKITNDTYCNIPDALLSDTLEMHGWDVTSVVPLMENNIKNKGVVELNIESLKEITNNKNIRWFDTTNIEDSNSSNYDIKFMRRLLLSSKRIFQSKGTQESIDMIMGMFGFGRKFNEEHEQDDNGDYKITEQWYNVEPLKYDEEVTKENGEKIKIGKWISEKNDNVGGYIDEGDEFANLPLNKVNKNNINYIIPYYDKNVNYEDVKYNFYFQSKGGWGHRKNDSESVFEEYAETVSYLKVLNTVNDLLQVRTIETTIGDVYYVIDLSNAPYVFGTTTDYSHFFYVKDSGSTTNPETWGNVDMTTEENMLDDNMLRLRQKALYLDNILNSSFGNNPHVGFGNYDDGKTFYEYLKNPFKGFIESNKIKELNDKERETLTFRNGFDSPIEEEYEYGDGKRIKCQRKLYNSINDNEEYRVKINSKVVCLENCMKSKEGGEEGMILYKKYFRKVMLPYIMQVIPSTTILILKNF